MGLTALFISIYSIRNLLFLATFALATFRYLCYNTGNRSSCNRDGGNPVSRQNDRFRALNLGKEPQCVCSRNVACWLCIGPVRGRTLRIVMVVGLSSADDHWMSGPLSRGATRHGQTGA
jgi:hypothetical protein